MLGTIDPDHMDFNRLSVENIRRVFSNEAEKINPEELYRQARAIQRAYEDKRNNKGVSFAKTASDFLGVKAGDLVFFKGKFHPVGRVREEDGKVHFTDIGGAYSPNLLPLSEEDALSNPDAPKYWLLATTKAECDLAHKRLKDQIRSANQAGARANLI